MRGNGAEAMTTFRCVRCLVKVSDTYGGNCWDCEMGTPRPLATEAVLYRAADVVRQLETSQTGSTDR